jgi:hypothetical protein
VEKSDCDTHTQHKYFLFQQRESELSILIRVLIRAKTGELITAQVDGYQFLASPVTFRHLEELDFSQISFLEVTS